MYACALPHCINWNNLDLPFFLFWNKKNFNREWECLQTQQKSLCFLWNWISLSFLFHWRKTFNSFQSLLYWLNWHDRIFTCSVIYLVFVFRSKCSAIRLSCSWKQYSILGKNVRGTSIAYEKIQEKENFSCSNLTHLCNA